MTNKELLFWSAVLVIIASFFAGVEDELNRQQSEHNKPIYYHNF